MEKMRGVGKEGGKEKEQFFKRIRKRREYFRRRREKRERERRYR